MPWQYLPYESTITAIAFGAHWTLVGSSVCVLVCSRILHVRRFLFHGLLHTSVLDCAKPWQPLTVIADHQPETTWQCTSHRGKLSSHHDAALRCAYARLSNQQQTPGKPWSRQHDALQLGVQGALRGDRVPPHQLAPVVHLLDALRLLTAQPHCTFAMAQVL